MPKKSEMHYRRPLTYIPPYNYCDRWCDRCRIDKTKCLLYQTEMDEQLHREIDGKGEPTPEEVVERIKGDISTALRLVEEQAREMGLDPEAIQRESAEEPDEPEEDDPIVERAAALARAVASFLRSRGRSFPEEAEALRRYFMLPGPKLGRATGRHEDEVEVADAILSAQVAHKALGELARALDSIRRARPSLADEMLEPLALIQKLRKEIEERWLSLPCGLLGPAPDDEWWGPLRDITPTLRHFRR